MGEKGAPPYAKQKKVILRPTIRFAPRLQFRDLFFIEARDRHTLQPSDEYENVRWLDQHFLSLEELPSTLALLYKAEKLPKKSEPGPTIVNLHERCVLNIQERCQKDGREQERLIFTGAMGPLCAVVTLSPLRWNLGGNTKQAPRLKEAAKMRVMCCSPLRASRRANIWDKI